MVQKNSLKKVIVIVGPTGVGKTKLSIDVAKKYNLEIINCDQSQMRKELNIGTAKITKEEMSGVKHHLLDFLDSVSDYSIKDFQDDARYIIDNMESIPLIVGGSGLYIDALITDYDLNNEKRDDDLEDQYQTLSNEELYQKLFELNPEAAKKTHPNNRKRVLRYLQIVLEKGTIESKPNLPYYDSLIIFLNKDREILYQNINIRCDQMIQNGWIEEVQNLISNNVDIEKIKEIGYKDLKQYLDNEITLEEATDNIKKETRHYAKRQITWFKNKMDCIEVENDAFAFEKVCNFIDDFLK